jgi:hypothetical protein
MRTIRLFVIATAALILTVVMTTSNVKAAANATNSDGFGGRPPIRGGLGVLPPLY